MKLLNRFVVKGSPSTRTAQQRGVRVVRGHAQFYEKKEITQAKAELADKLLCHVPDEPYKGDIFIRVMWLFCKASLSRKEQRTFKQTRPDLDNLCKGFLDVMTDVGFWDDDAQIVKMELQKAWSAQFPGLFVEIWQLEEGDYETEVEGWVREE